ncbi:MarR family transcriptional regulator [Enemella evansiae]|uniref:MarR family winged helix-turn-helix transcriptional regulator n=1 Tax=Enemella evansiae TaxID=2016499 RepID=UPI000B96A7B8|nr:MarR family transcriptional regulator [Enemella evansiae]OYO16515.1 MarR family transcriptional regulator [Enemella evansiae]
MDLSFELHDLVLTMDRQAGDLLAPLGVSLRQHIALTIIGQHPGLAGRELAGGLRVSAPATTGIVRGLLAAGWVVDAAEPGSGNRQQLRLSDSGTALLGRTTAALGSGFDELVRRSGHDPEALARALRDIHELMLSPEPTSDDNQNGH